MAFVSHPIIFVSKPRFSARAATTDAAFLIDLWVYTPWLMQTRLDGQDG